ncbi:FadR family transcriptional regulator [Agromyces archimandritae]|uniref:FadR family transcriptional regulator n=1 Tax=Agromyces archimandritae TaxID=2781962 RepID=A0A975IQ71_9MICO|nr:FadR family transcriptional regulator [Agromyces archimandritae]
MPLSRGEQIARALSDRIVDGDIAPGERLPSEAKLSAEFGASRAAVREALQRLKTLGYVRTRTGSGSYALTPPAEQGDDTWLTARSDAERGELVVFRTAIETEAAASAARHRSEADLVEMRAALEAIDAARRPSDSVDADFRFHRTIARAAGNRYLAAALDRIGARAIVVPASRIAHGDRLPAATASVRAEHSAIADAIERSDPLAAQAAMRAHLVASERRRTVDGIEPDRREQHRYS